MEQNKSTSNFWDCSWIAVLRVITDESFCFQLLYKLSIFTVNQKDFFCNTFSINKNYFNYCWHFWTVVHEITFFFTYYLRWVTSFFNMTKLTLSDIPAICPGFLPRVLFLWIYFYFCNFLPYFSKLFLCLWKKFYTMNFKYWIEVKHD